MPIQQGTIGGIGLKADEFKEIVLEVTEDAVVARQAAYDTVMEVLSETVRGEKAIQFLATLTDEDFARMAAEDPGETADMLKALREEQEAS